MTAQNIRSEQKKLQHSRLQSGREIYEKLSTSGGLVWGFWNVFFQISPPDCNPECWSFFYSLRVFCAVILNTINPYSLTIFFLGPPLGQKISDANPPISKYFFTKKNLLVLLLSIKTTQKKFRLIKKKENYYFHHYLLCTHKILKCRKVEIHRIELVKQIQTKNQLPSSYLF